MSAMVETVRPLVVLPALSLWRREIVRFIRQRSRVVGALGTPIVFWLLIGSGFGSSFRASADGDVVNHLEYAFPGTAILILLFTAIFSNISIIEDRREGFLQGVLVAPVSRMAIVLGKVMGSTSLAVAQAALFLMLAPLAGIHPTWGAAAASIGVMVLVGFMLSALGFLVAWPLDSTQGFHAVMNLFLMPLWLLSGALFPADGAAGWMRWLMMINPLSYGVAALRHTLYLSQNDVGDGPTFGLSLGITALFTVGMLFLAVRAVGRE